MSKPSLLFKAAAIAVAFSLSACSTATIRAKGTAKLASEPTYEDSKAFFLWGLVNKHDVDVAQVCRGQQAVQMQSQFTFLDGFLSLITLGIYSPRTAKVWCQAQAKR